MSCFCGIVSRGGKIEFPDRVANQETGRTARRGDLRVAEKFLDKFADDKCFGDRGDYFVCLDGVTLNSREFVRSFAATDIGSAVAVMAAKDPSGFPAALRGGFGGFIWDIAESIGVFFTNHFGSRYLYYFYDASTGVTFFSSSLADMAEMMRSTGRATRLDETAGYDMLSFGYMADERTLIEGVRKLEPGRCLEIAAGQAPQIKRHFVYNNENFLGESFDEIADEFYKRISLAARKGFEKDLEYGYRHLSLLSGGLDSRMILFFARKGEYVETDAHVAQSAEECAYLKRFLPRVKETIGVFLRRYPNQEAFADAILNGSVSAQGFTETDEPFLPPDLASWAARISQRYKRGEHIFLAMINKHFPEAATYPWQRWRLNPKLANMERLKTPAFHFIHRGRKAISYVVDGTQDRPSARDMNPFNYWYKNNPELRAEFACRWTLMGDALSGHGYLAEDCVRLFDEGSELEKAQAITLATAAKRLKLA